MFAKIYNCVLWRSHAKGVVKIPYIPLANACLITMKNVSTLAINNSCTIKFLPKSMLLCISDLIKIYDKRYTLYIM